MLSNERQEVEEYLATYCLEECLDEALNEVVEKKPPNPYAMIANFMEAKTFPEIMEVYLFPTVVGNGHAGCEAIVETNIGRFSGTVGFPYAQSNQDIFRDFTDQLTRVRDILKAADPTNLSEIDVTLNTIEDLDPTVSLALSIAFCRAGAKHKGHPYLN